MGALAALVGGGLIGVGFLPGGTCLAVVPGLGLLLLAARGESAACRFGLGLGAGMAGFALAVHWLPPTIVRFTQARPLASWCIFLIIAAYHSLQLGIFAAAARLGGRRSLLADCCVLASLWVVVEWAFPRLVPWVLGDVTARSVLLRQAADFAGVHGLSFALVFAASALAHAACGPARQRALLAGAGTIAIMAIYGILRLGSAGTEGAAAAGAHVVAIQGGVGRLPNRQEQNARAWETYERMTRIAAQDRSRKRRSEERLAVWPETTLEAYLREDPVWRRQVETLASQIEAGILLGAFDRSPAVAGDFKSAFLIFPGGASGTAEIQRYGKQILVPFAETVPGPSLLGRLGWQAPPGGLRAAQYRGPLVLPNGTRLGLSICFEILYPGILNAAVRDGANLLVNLSDDGWFTGAVEPRQHLNGAVLRAVETRRWLLRVSDSGITALIDPMGRIVGRLNVGAVGALRAFVPAKEEISPYVALGDWVVWVSLACAAISFALAPRRSAAGRSGRVVDT